MRPGQFRRACVAIISLSLVSLGMQAPAHAGVVSTAEAVAAAQGGSPRGQVDAALARADVQAKLAEMGVDLASIQGRVAALTDDEVAVLADRMGDAPAGGDALAVIGVVFLVLLILEVVGVIDIFKKT
jgi:hypothetical protein